MNNKFAVTLDSLLRKDGRTAAAIAKEASIGAPYLSQLRKGGKIKPAMDVIVRLANTLGVPVTRFTDGESDDSSEFAGGNILREEQFLPPPTGAADDGMVTVEQFSGRLREDAPFGASSQVLEDIMPLLGRETTSALVDRMFEKAKADHAYFLRNGETIRRLVNYLKTPDPNVEP